MHRHFPILARWAARRLLVALVLAAAFVVEPASAVERVYNIVTNQSSITIAGTVTSSSLGTESIDEQGPGSLTTSYSGTIHTDRGADTIQFLAGTAADASVNGNWQPRPNASSGSAPADYGGRVPFNALATLFFAARDIVGDFTSGVLPVDAGGNFNLANVNLTFTSGSIAYRDSPFGLESDVIPLVGEGGTLSGTGSLTTQAQADGILETLQIPLNTTVNITTGDESIFLTLTGQVVATTLLPAQLLGDYNQNGAVDAADYVVWRKNLGGATSLPNDDTPGIGQDDYTRWRAHFGQTAAFAAAHRAGQSPPARGDPPVGVPEPSGLVLTLGLPALRYVFLRRPLMQRA